MKKESIEVKNNQNLYLKSVSGRLLPSSTSVVEEWEDQVVGDEDPIF